MTTKIECVQLRTGQKFPLIGLGTWQAKKGEVGNSVRAAIEEVGYRHIDCASNYLNEDEVGDTLTDLFKRGVVKREDLFITGKLNNPYHHKEHVRPHLLKTLKDLNVEYLDLWLMHWPVGFAYVPYDETRRGFDSNYDPDGCSKVDLTPYGGTKVDRTVSIRETWEAMEAVYKEGLVKAIGVSNFTGVLIHDLLTYATVKPAVNQIELHPFLQHPHLVSYCHSQNIQVEAYSPLGTGGFKKDNEPTVLEDPLIVGLAQKYNKTPAQIVLRWHTMRKVVAIPKSVHANRIRQNAEIFDFSLSGDEMKAMAGLDRDYHYLRPQDWYGLPFWE